MFTTDSKEKLEFTAELWNITLMKKLTNIEPILTNA